MNYFEEKELMEAKYKYFSEDPFGYSQLMKSCPSEREQRLNFINSNLEKLLKDKDTSDEMLLDFIVKASNNWSGVPYTMLEILFKELKHRFKYYGQGKGKHWPTKEYEIILCNIRLVIGFACYDWYGVKPDYNDIDDSYAEIITEIKPKIDSTKSKEDDIADMLCSADFWRFGKFLDAMKR